MTLLKQSNGSSHSRLLIVLALLVLAAGCGSGPRAAPPAPPAGPQLRVSNGGTQPIQGLVILFPGETSSSPAREVVFGDVGVGVTTDYQPVPGGVYSYAAYSYTLGGKTIIQPVIDWVGEAPLPGVAFTYRLALDPAQVQGRHIVLLGVTTDRP